MMSVAAESRPLRLGHLTLELPVIQSALSGYSDWPMRNVARRLGAPYTICEVMLDTFVRTLRDRSRTRRFLMLTDEDHPAGAQLMGSDPETFSAAARQLADAGFDVIDINFGCPVRTVLRRCRGGFHLGQPEVALEIVRRVRDALPWQVPVTLKMRRGIDDSRRSRDNFFRILDGAFKAGIAAVTVHGRTVEQRYVGPSNWEFLSEICSLWPDRTILGSGDLFSAEDCVRMLRQTGVHGVSAARGSIGNPWIFAQCAELLAGHPLLPAPTVYEQRNVLLMHFDCADQVSPVGKACRQMRKFGLRYADWHPQADRVRADFLSVRKNSDWLDTVKRWYSADHPGVYPVDPGRPKPPARRTDAPPIS